MNVGNLADRLTPIPPQSEEERITREEGAARKALKAKNHLRGEERLRAAATLARGYIFADHHRAAMIALNWGLDETEIIE